MILFSNIFKNMPVLQNQALKYVTELCLLLKRTYDREMLACDICSLFPRSESSLKSFFNVRLTKKAYVKVEHIIK